MSASPQQRWEGLEERQKPLYGPSCLFPVRKSTESSLDKGCCKSKAEPQPWDVPSCPRQQGLDVTLVLLYSMAVAKAHSHHARTSPCARVTAGDPAPNVWRDKIKLTRNSLFETLFTTARCFTPTRPWSWWHMEQVTCPRWLLLKSF